MPYKVILVGAQARSGQAALEREHSVSACALAREALELLSRGAPDLMVVDLDLGDMDGLTFLRVLKETAPRAPLLAVGLHKPEATVLETFALGVEDYLAAPFDPRELAVRARTILRRRYERLDHWEAALELGGVAIDPAQRQCLVNGRRVPLQPREFELLEALMRRANRVLSRAYLLETVWGMERSARTRAIDVMVSRLRRKLGPRAGRLVETVSKLGYCFRPPDR